MATKIALINNKGGSAKTTTAINLAGAYASKFPERKVLIAETDGQGNATSSFNLKAKSFENSMYDVFLDNYQPEDVIVNAFQNIDIIPANGDMNFVEFDLMATYEIRNSKNIHSLLLSMNFNEIKEMSPNEFHQFIDDNTEKGLTDNYFNMIDGKFDEVDKKYDLIIFDTPPEVKAITSSVLSIADKVIIPYEPDSYSIEGVVNILGRVASIKENYNPNLEIAGILAVKVKDRTNLHVEVRNRMMKYCLRRNIYYFESEIPNSITFASSTSFKGLPATITIKDNKFVQSYYDLIDEMIEREVI